LEVLSSTELSSVALPSTVVGAGETMLMSTSALERPRPLVRNAVILLSSLRFVPKMRALFARTWTPSKLDRAVPTALLACSCLATAQGAFRDLVQLFGSNMKLALRYSGLPISSFTTAAACRSR
jgi:hypothetical protein